MSTGINVGSVISPDILKNISSSTAIKTFGDQLIDKTKQKVISTALGKIQTLENQIQEIVVLEAKVWSDHGTELKRLDVLLKEKQITQEKYNKAVEKENEAYLAKKKNLEDLKKKLQQDLKNILADPLRKIKENKNKRKVKQNKRKTRNKAEQAKARRDLAKKVAKNAAKSLAPVLALQLANKFATILSQRSKLEELVDKVNVYIEQANTPETIAIAVNLRNNAISLINNSISKLSSLEKLIQQISLYITVFTIIVDVLSAIPIPTAVPPGIGIPVNVITKIVKSLEKASKLIVSLSVITVTATVVLENEISKLNDLIARLKEVSQTLDQSALSNLNNQDLSNLTSGLLANVDQYPEYKGFKFKIKEEQTLGASQAIVVKGIKRHYAVAIDRDGVEVLKSEYSFTQDPNDLVDQLKLIIDQKNLQG